MRDSHLSMNDRTIPLAEVPDTLWLAAECALVAAALIVILWG